MFVFLPVFIVLSAVPRKHSAILALLVWYRTSTLGGLIPTKKRIEEKVAKKAYKSLKMLGSVGEGGLRVVGGVRTQPFSHLRARSAAS